MRYDCLNDFVTLTTPIVDTNYFISKPEISLAATYTNNVATCPLQYTLTLSTGGGIDTNVVTFDSATGGIKVSTSNFATYDQTTMNLKLTYTSTVSTHTNAAVSNDFVLTLQDECWTTTLTAPSFGTTTYASENLWTQMSFSYSALSESIGTCGAVTYTFKITETTTTKQTDADAVFSANGLTTFEGTASDMTKWVGTFTFYVTATLTNYSTKTIDSNQISVTISNPCFTSTITDAQTISNLAVSVHGASDSTSFTAFTDAISTASAAFGANNCGVPTYRITMTDGTSGVPNYLSLSGTTLTASSVDTA